MSNSTQNSQFKGFLHFSETPTSTRDGLRRTASHFLGLWRCRGTAPQYPEEVLIRFPRIKECPKGPKLGVLEKY